MHRLERVSLHLDLARILGSVQGGVYAVEWSCIAVWL